MTPKPRIRPLSRVFSALGALGTLPALLHAQARPAREAPAPGWPAFAQALQAFVSGEQVVGASAVLVRNGTVVRHLELGLADRASGQKVDERTIYHWASITKTLTAIAIMQLRDRGMLTLDDKVTAWVPELRQVHDPYGSMDDITIRMLLAHTSGFQNPTWPYGSGAAWQPFEPTRWEQLVAMMPYQELLFAPGSRYGYSNPAFIYLARIIEAITGDPYQSYIQKNIWTPLGMARSYFGATPYFLAADRSAGYTIERDSTGRDTLVAGHRDFDPGVTIPNGGWNAPVADLVTYLAFLSNATRGDTALARRYDTVLKHSTLEEMWQPTLLTTGGNGPAGLSFFVDRVGTSTIVSHTGEQAGFRLYFALNPASSEAVIVALNTINYAHGSRWDTAWESLFKAGTALVGTK
ncbi:MAG: flp 1 [Gemmatimonadetes bacterium]|nr:flp 1 [Gemmatimonadota bacterium]